MTCGACCAVHLTGLLAAYDLLPVDPPEGSVIAPIIPGCDCGTDACVDILLASGHQFGTLPPLEPVEPPTCIPTVITEGDSRTVSPRLGVTQWPTFLDPGAPTVFHNVAEGSATAASMVSQVATQIAPLVTPDTVVIFQAGINDLLTVGVTGADVYADITLWVAAVQATGATVVVMTVPFASSITAAATVELGVLNGLIVDNAAGADTVVDIVSLCPQLADVTDTSYFIEGVHLTETANEEIADKLRPFIDPCPEP